MDMQNLSQIGLDKEQSKYIADRLNSLLADYTVFYQNLRGFHWNIKGTKFFVLHAKFEELYDNVAVKIDDVAERILALGFTPRHSLSDYLNISEIKEAKNVSDFNEAVTEILDSLKTLIIKQREILKSAEKAGDIGTADLMTQYTREEEKLVWMYAAYMQEQLVM